MPRWRELVNTLCRGTICNRCSEIHFDICGFKENKRLQKRIQSMEEARAADSVDVLLRHILRNFLKRLNIDQTRSQGVYSNARVMLTEENLRVIRKYMESDRTAEEFGLREDVRYALEDFISEVLTSRIQNRW